MKERTDVDGPIAVNLREVDDYEFGTETPPARGRSAPTRS